VIHKAWKAVPCSSNCSQVIGSLKRALQPAVTDLSIKFNVPSTFKVYQAPEDLPTLFSGDKAVVYGIMKKRKSASDHSFRESMNGTATLTGQILGKPIEFKITFEIPPTSDFQSVEMPIVHHLASKSLIHELQMGEDWSDAATTRKQKNRIVNLSLESGVVSLHTAYIALDEEQDKVVEGAMKTWDVLATMTLYKESMFPPSKRMPTTMSSPLASKRSSSLAIKFPQKRRQSSAKRLSDSRASVSCQIPSLPTHDLAMCKTLSPRKPIPYKRIPTKMSSTLTSMSDTTPASKLSFGSVAEKSRQTSGLHRFGFAHNSDYSQSLEMWPPHSTAISFSQTHPVGAQGIPNDQEDKSSVQKSIVSPKEKLELEFLISLQSAEGFWGLDVLQLLNFVPPFISYHIKQICATVCALAYMEIKFPSRRDEWELVAKKAEAWLEHQKLPNEVNLDELKKDMSDYIINNLFE